MKTRLLLVTLLAAFFGWGFATLVSMSDRDARDGNDSFGCADWPNCSEPAPRRQP